MIIFITTTSTLTPKKLPNLVAKEINGCQKVRMVDSVILVSATQTSEMEMVLVVVAMILADQIISIVATDSEVVTDLVRAQATVAPISEVKVAALNTIISEVDEKFKLHHRRLQLAEKAFEFSVYN